MENAIGQINYLAVIAAALSALKLLLVNGGYHTVQYTLYGLILGLWH